MRTLIGLFFALTCLVVLPPPLEAAGKRIDIRVTGSGYEPAQITVKKDEPVVLTFTRTADAGCLSSVIVELGGGKEVKKDLPLGKPVSIEVRYPTTGELHYQCGMRMVTGTITVK